MGGTKAATRVWDIPVRLTHWLLVLLLAFSWWSAEEGRLDWHRLSGYALLALVVFRLCWGLVGSDTARFGRFLRGPTAIGAYLSKLGSKEREPVVGHNPLGGWSVLAMLLLLAAQAVLGLFAIDVDGIESGPLAYFVNFDEGRLAAGVHELVFNVILALVALHLIAIAFYAVFKRDNLIGPMITGVKAIEGAPSAPRMAPLWLALLVLAAAVTLVYTVSQGFWAI